MNKPLKQGLEAPFFPRLQWDEPIFKEARLVGVTRRSCWRLPAKPNCEYRLLVVNDVRGIADMISEFLKLVGFQVETAYDGIAGLAAARSIMPDLALLNCMMPGLSGIQVLQQLRRDPETARMKVIIESASPIRELALQSGAQDFVRIPIHFDELLEKIARILRS